MGRFVLAAKATGAGSATLPMMSLYSPAANGGILREIGVWNAAATAVELELRRLTSAGTQGAGLTEIEMMEDGPAPTLTGFQAHSAGPTISTGALRSFALGAAIGSGVIFTFAGRGLVIPPGTGNGLGLVPIGTGQICLVHWEWEE